jgi:hypothetical protein
MFNVAVNLAKATSFQGYEGRQARAELAAMFPVTLDMKAFIAGAPLPEVLQVSLPRTVPGYYQYKQIADTLKYANDGNYLNAFYALTSAPIRMDLR